MRRRPFSDIFSKASIRPGMVRENTSGSDVSPFVTVIIPCRNERDCIGVALDSVLANEWPAERMEVLVVDSDESNAGLHRMLGLDGPPTPLMELAGGRKNVRRALAAEAGEASVLSRDTIRPDDIPAEHVSARDGLRMVSVGK